MTVIEETADIPPLLSPEPEVKRVLLVWDCLLYTSPSPRDS